MTDKSNLTVQYMKVSDLVPYINNSRTHDADQIQQVANSIQEFGFTNPILIDENKNIIAGHGRLRAANKLAMDEVPTITITGLTEDQRKAYVIADNKLALNSDWNLDLLMDEIYELRESGFDETLLGFTIQELDDLFDMLSPNTEEPKSHAQTHRDIKRNFEKVQENIEKRKRELEIESIVDLRHED